MKVNSKVKPVVFIGEEGAQVSFEYDNMGEPFREGVSIVVESEYGEKHFSAFFDETETRLIHSFLTELLQANNPPGEKIVRDSNAS